jgi:hypothetical protein
MACVDCSRIIPCDDAFIDSCNFAVIALEPLAVLLDKRKVLCPLAHVCLWWTWEFDPILETDQSSVIIKGKSY